MSEVTHTLIVGRTRSGKTTLAKRIAEKYKAKGIQVLVLDPMLDPQWATEYVYEDPQEFLQVVFQSQSCAIFVDESGDAIGRYGGAMNKLATKGRHWGHKCHYISQRANQIDPTTRTQCDGLFLFKSSLTDCDILSKEFAEPMLKTANSLNQGECFYTDGFSPCERLNIF